MKSKPIKKSNTISKIKGNTLRVLGFLLIATVFAMLLKIKPIKEKFLELTGFEETAFNSVIDDVQLVLAGLVFFFLTAVFSPFIWLAIPCAIIGLLFVAPVIYKHVLQEELTGL